MICKNDNLFLQSENVSVFLVYIRNIMPYQCFNFHEDQFSMRDIVNFFIKIKQQEYQKQYVEQNFNF